LQPSTRALLSSSAGTVSKYAFMIHTVNGSVNQQYATVSPVSVFWSPMARSMRKTAGMSTTVGNRKRA